MANGESEQPGPDRAHLSQEQLARLLAVGRALVSDLDLESVLEQVLETARDLTSARYAALGILDERKSQLERFLAIGLDDEARRAIGPLPRGHGVLGELIRDPRPLRLRDVTEHPRSYGFPPGHPQMKTFLGVPVAVRGEAYGNLYLTDKAGGEEFTESDEQLVVVLSEWAAVAIDNARLYERVERRRRELERAVRGLEATSAISRAVGFETELDRVLELIAKRGRAMSEARSFLVLLQRDDSLRVEAAAGEADADIVGIAIPADSSLAGTVAATGVSELVADLDARGGHGLESLTGDARALVMVPLGFRGRARGVLIALDRTRDGPAFDSEDEHLLGSFAASAAIAIATAQSVEADRLRHSMRASDEERARWARELHDDTLQDLGALKVMLDSANRTQDPARMQTTIEQALTQIELSIRSLQSLITELRPAALDQIGLVPALEALVKRVGATSGMEVELQISLAADAGEQPTRLHPEIEGTLYRLAQESLTNAVKHASAQRVRVGLVEENDTITLRVADDGVGFDQEQGTTGFGLVGMKDRAALLGGQLRVHSTPGEGTRVTAEVPARHLERPRSVGPSPAAGAPASAAIRRRPTR